ncbi:B1 bradykinin receptor-like [Saccostrea cucullata]|uniref:B1 bradykinin receptor-like n=1 Tax=Saccostrea cuccullata TaxID=36930 RepID=UPI002ED3F4B5
MNFSIEEYYSILIEILKSADEEDIPSQALIDAWRITEIYVQPVICVIGFLGNLTAARVFTSKNLRLNSSNLYLASLSCFTSVYMLLVLLSWLAVVNVPVINQNGICQLVVFLTYVCSFMTVWLIAVITFEHYVIVHHIRAARFVCKRRKAKILVSCLIATSLLLYSTTLWSTRVEQRSNMLVCTPGSDQRALLTRLVFFIDMISFKYQDIKTREIPPPNSSCSLVDQSVPCRVQQSMFYI